MKSAVQNTNDWQMAFIFFFLCNFQKELKLKEVPDPIALEQSFLSKDEDATLVPTIRVLLTGFPTITETSVQ